MISSTLKFKNFKFFHTFVYKFKSPKEKTFLIKPLKQENLEENSQNLAKTFKYEPLCERYEYEYLLPIFRKIAHKSSREDLGITCYEESTGKWAGCILIEDFSTNSTDPIMNYDGKNNFIINFLSYIQQEGFKKVEIKVSKNKYEQIHLVPGGVNLDFWGNKILFNMIKFLLNEHPIIKNSKIVFAECSNSFSRRACEENGLKTVYGIKYSEMAEKEEFKEYLKNYKQMLKILNKSEDEFASFNCIIKY